MIGKNRPPPDVDEALAAAKEDAKMPQIRTFNVKGTVLQEAISPRLSDKGLARFELVCGCHRLRQASSYPPMLLLRVV